MLTTPMAGASLIALSVVSQAGAEAIESLLLHAACRKCGGCIGIQHVAQAADVKAQATSKDTAAASSLVQAEVLA